MSPMSAEATVVRNIGSGEEWSIEQTVGLLMEITGRSASIRCDQTRLRPEQSEVNRLLADNRKIKSLTNWENRIHFREGLVKTAEWIEQNLKLFDLDRHTL